MMKFTLSRLLPLVVGSAAASVLASMSPAKAVVLTVNNVDYHVESVTSNYLVAANRLKTQRWWQNENLARAFADASRNVPNFTQDVDKSTLFEPLRLKYSPFFLFTDLMPLPNNLHAAAFNYFDIKVEVADGPSDAVVTYAVESVPWEFSGGTIPAAVGVLLLAARWKARKSIASKTRTANPDVAVS